MTKKNEDNRLVQMLMLAELDRKHAYQMRILGALATGKSEREVREIVLWTR